MHECGLHPVAMGRLSKEGVVREIQHIRVGGEGLSGLRPTFGYSTEQGFPTWLRTSIVSSSL